MGKIWLAMKNIFDVDNSKGFQLYNYVTSVVIVVIIKIFLILMSAGDTFVSQFEVCVWVFMTIWLVLIFMHSIMSLQGYYLVSSLFLLLYIIIPGTNHWLINISISFTIMCILIELIMLIKGLFNKESKNG